MNDEKTFACLSNLWQAVFVNKQGLSDNTIWRAYQLVGKGLPGRLPIALQKTSNP